VAGSLYHSDASPSNCESSSIGDGMGQTINRKYKKPRYLVQHPMETKVYFNCREGYVNSFFVLMWSETSTFPSSQISPFCVFRTVFGFNLFLRNMVFQKILHPSSAPSFTQFSTLSKKNWSMMENFQKFLIFVCKPHCHLFPVDRL